MREELIRCLAEVPDLVGVSCIARGADSMFALAVLEVDGWLEVVLPNRNYREVSVSPIMHRCSMSSWDVRPRFG